MARTRGTSLIHQDDGELLDKEGNPIPVEALRSPEAAMAALAVPPEPETSPEPPPPPADPVYRCDSSTCQRDMNGWELIRVLDLMLGGLSLEMGAAEFSGLHPDVRRHFRRVA